MAVDQEHAVGRYDRLSDIEKEWFSSAEAAVRSTELLESVLNGERKINVEQTARGPRGRAFLPDRDGDIGYLDEARYVGVIRDESDVLWVEKTLPWGGLSDIWKLDPNTQELSRHRTIARKGQNSYTIDTFDATDETFEGRTAWNDFLNVTTEISGATISQNYDPAWEHGSGKCRFRFELMRCSQEP